MPKDRKPKRKEADQKTSDLRRTGTLNPRPNAVSDSLFKENPFFDPKDLLQAFATRCCADTAWKDSRSWMWRPLSAFRAPLSIRLKLDSRKAA